MKALTALFVLCLFFTTTAQISTTERQALEDFFHSTNGPEWNTEWDLTKPVDTWYGVQIKNNTVTGLELGFNNLQGEIPASIKNLENLESIKLFFNQIGGELPNEIGLLKNLKVLDLNSNLISGNIPASVFELDQLETLLLSSNNFTGVVSSDIAQLKNLKNLVLFDNHFFGDFPLAISNLNNLEELVLAENNFNSESLKTSLAALTKQGTKIDFDEFNKGVQNTEFAILEIEDEEND
ncbi:Two component regulator three Y domain protein [uncultured Planktosalinus sp.]|uniref:leucine-rich repeat domain-containing protein n=1 Tax=uncultured Planktosalinus sp. TaxID=1810935 RepID=UPI0030DD140A